MNFEIAKVNYENNLYTVSAAYNDASAYDPPLNSYVVINLKISIKYIESIEDKIIQLSDLKFFIHTDSGKYQNIDVKADEELMNYVSKTDSYYEYIGQDFIRPGQSQTYMLLFRFSSNKNRIINGISWENKSLNGSAEFVYDNFKSINSNTGKKAHNSIWVNGKSIFVITAMLIIISTIGMYQHYSNKVKTPKFKNINSGQEQKLSKPNDNTDSSAAKESKPNVSENNAAGNSVSINESGNEELTKYFSPQGKVLVFNGGFENGGFKRVTEIIKGSKIQVRVTDTGASSVGVYLISNNEIKLFFSKEDAENNLDFINAGQYENRTILKSPVKVGTSWMEPNGSSVKITGKNIIVQTPWGKYKTIEVTSQSDTSESKVYYAEGIGPVKYVTKFKSGLTMVSELIRIE